MHSAYKICVKWLEKLKKMITLLTKKIFFLESYILFYNKNELKF